MLKKVWKYPITLEVMTLLYILIETTISAPGWLLIILGLLPLAIYTYFRWGDKRLKWLSSWMVGIGVSLAILSDSQLPFGFLTNAAVFILMITSLAMLALIIEHVTELFLKFLQKQPETK